MKTHLAVLLNPESFILELKKAFPQIRWVLLPGLEFRKLKSRIPKKSFDFVLITSKTSVRFLSSLPKARQIICIGPKTYEAFRRKFKLKARVLKASHSEGILKFFKKTEASIFFPRSKLGDPRLVQSLEAIGCRVTTSMLYTTKTHSVRLHLKRLVKSRQLKAFFLTSPSSLKVVLRSISKQELKRQKWSFVAIGPTTRRQARLSGLAVIQSQKPDLASMARSFLRS